MAHMGSAGNNDARPGRPLWSPRFAHLVRHRATTRVALHHDASSDRPKQATSIFRRERFRDYPSLEERASAILRTARIMDVRAEFARRAFEEETLHQLLPTTCRAFSPLFRHKRGVNKQEDSGWK